MIAATTRTIGHKATWLTTAAFLLACAACSSDPAGDAGAGTDGSTQVDGSLALDAAPDSAKDAAPDATTDAAPDATTDAAGDAVAEVATDGGSGDTTPATSTVELNEIAAKGAAIGDFNPTGSDWIELYNSASAPVNLTAWRVGDKADDFAGAGEIPAGTIIDGKGHLVVFFNHGGEGSPVIDAGLGKDEEAALFTPSGDMVDFVDWVAGDSPSGGSYGRTPDGAAAWKTFVVATPGAANK